MIYTTYDVIFMFSHSMHKIDAKCEILVFFHNFYIQQLKRIIHLDIVCDVDIKSWKELIFTCTDLM